MPPMVLTFEDSENDLVAEGKYEVRVNQASLKTAKSGSSQMINLELIVTEDGEFFGRKLFTNLSLHPKAMWKTKKFLQALGVELTKSEDGKDQLEIDADEGTGRLNEPQLVDVSCYAVIKHETYQDKTRHAVDEILPLTGEYAGS